VHLAGDADEPRLRIELPAQPVANAVEVIKSLGPAVTGLGRLLR
jgi:hypothetical protein